MDNNKKLNSFIEELNSCILANYQLIEVDFNTEYGYPELDPVRDEVCKCIICGLNQAAITLTNHLLESSLKKCLAIKHCVDNKNTHSLSLDGAFKDGIAKYDNMLLYETIESAYSDGLITQEQAAKLHGFRINFRNAYSHADSSKTFKGISSKVNYISLNDDSSEAIHRKLLGELETEMQIKDLFPAHGIIQSIMSAKEAAVYFSEVNEIIKCMLSNIHKDI